MGNFGWPVHARQPVVRRFDKPAHDPPPNQREGDPGDATKPEGDGTAAPVVGATAQETTRSATATDNAARPGRHSHTALPTGGAARPHPGSFGWPLQPRPRIMRRFDKPAHDWLPGHRGVDLGGVAGQPVLASGDGVVVFAGEVAGKPVVSIDHPGGLRTTYEPVRASVPVGRRVIRGETLGALEPGHPGCATPCLHWGLRRGREYLDPLGLIHLAPLRLKPARPDG